MRMRMKQLCNVSVEYWEAEHRLASRAYDDAEAGRLKAWERMKLAERALDEIAGADLALILGN